MKKLRLPLKIAYAHTRFRFKHLPRQPRTTKARAGRHHYGRHGLARDGNLTASTRPTVEECLRYAREADLLVGIIAWRYGWEPDGTKSITEMEYEAAEQRLMFSHRP